MPEAAAPHPRQVEEVLRAITGISREHGATPARPVLVGLDGRAGTGKTSLAAAVASELAAPVVHLDDLYPGWDGLAATPALVTVQVLLPLRRSEPAAYRRFDWAAGMFAESVPVRAAPAVIIEGCGSTAAPATDLLDLRVWLRAPTEVRRHRAVARDGATFEPHWDRWAAQEEALFGIPERSQDRDDFAPTHADLVLDTAGVVGS
ncbi:hypothetical protein ACMYYO_08410 [Dermacoccaceae bacterium W4C1]